MLRQRAVVHRLQRYWKIEALNVLLIPTITLLMVRPRRWHEWLGIGLGLTVCCALLAVGAYYWKAASERAMKQSHRIIAFLPLADALQRPLAVLTGALVATALLTLTFSGAARGTVGTLILAVLAVLEFVNYYHFQLQYFDHQPDWLRLMRDKKLRQSHLSKDLASYRRDKQIRASFPVP